MLTRLFRKDELEREGIFGLVVMPYAPIKEPFEIGDYEILQFDAEYKKRFTDAVALQKAEESITSFRRLVYDIEEGLIHTPVKDIWIVSPNDFTPGEDSLTNREIEEMQMISYILAFSSINESLASSSDAFRIFFLELNIFSEKLCVWGTDFNDFRAALFLKPYHLDATVIKYEKTPLCDALGSALEQSEEKVPSRIFRALEIFFHAAAHNEMMRPETRIVLLALCFESLLGFKNKNDFARKVEELVDIESPIMETRKISLKKGKKTVREEYTAPKTVWWAYDLYDLRAKIVRADKTLRLGTIRTKNKYTNVWANLEFGRILLRKLIKAIMIGERYLEQDFAHKVSDAILDPDNLDERLLNIIEKSDTKG